MNCRRAALLPSSERWATLLTVAEPTEDGSRLQTAEVDVSWFQSCQPELELPPSEAASLTPIGQLLRKRANT
jgi:hypothetical protein